MCSTDIFKGYSNDNFLYYKHFGFNETIIGSKIIQENKEPQFIYFLTEGEYEVSFFKSFYEISETICLIEGTSWLEEKLRLSGEIGSNRKYFTL